MKSKNGRIALILPFYLNTFSVSNSLPKILNCSAIFISSCIQYDKDTILKAIYNKEPRYYFDYQLYSV